MDNKKKFIPSNSSKRLFYLARKMSEYGVFSGPYFPVVGLNKEIFKSPYIVQVQENMDQKKNPYLDTFDAV